MTKYVFCLFVFASCNLFAQKGLVKIDGKTNDFVDINSFLATGPLTRSEEKMLENLPQINLGVEDTKVIWGRIGFSNDSGRDQEYVLRVSRDFGADQVKAYAFSEGNHIDTYETSGFLSNLPKDVASQHDLYISIFLGKDKQTWVYLENAALEGYPPFFDLELKTLWGWHNQATKGLVFQAVFHGVLWSLLIFSFVLFTQTKDRTFLYYSLYLIAFSMFSAVIYNTVGFVFDLPNRPLFFLLFGQSFHILYLLFLKDFILLSKLSAWWNNLVRVFAALLIAASVFGVLYQLIFAGSVLFADLLVRVSGSLNLLVMIATSILCISKGSNVSKYVAYGTLAMIAGILTSFLHVVVFDDQTTIYGQLGVLVKSLIFSIGLSSRVRVEAEKQGLVQKKLIAQLKENQKLQRTMNSELERMVTESTEEVLSQKQEIEEKASLLEEKNASLNKASAFKDQLFAIIGHDLRNPIKSLKSVLDLHTKGQLRERELESFVSKIHKSLNRVISLLDNVLMWALQQMDHIDYQPSTIAIRSLVQDNVELLAPLAIEKQIDLVNRVDSKLQAFADPEMIKLVIRNILSNAIKFSNRGEVVEIKGSDGSDTILLHVTDCGIGIPREDIDKLFDDVVHTTYGTAHEKGTGLGLSLCNEFVKKNNGFIYVESELGKGSTFTIELPTKNLRLTA